MSILIGQFYVLEKILIQKCLNKMPPSSKDSGGSFISLHPVKNFLLLNLDKLLLIILIDELYCPSK